jgi:hypothetical protein
MNVNLPSFAQLFGAGCLVMCAAGDMSNRSVQGHG